MTMLQHGMTGTSGVDVGDIQNSLRFRRSASPSLSRSQGVASDKKKGTLSLFCKRGDLGVDGVIYDTSGTTDATRTIVLFETDNTLSVWQNSGRLRRTTRVFRDPSAHFHIQVYIDTTVPTVKVFINGTEETSFSVTANPILNADCGFGYNGTIWIGRNAGAGAYSDMYLSRICFVDGQALTPSSFGYQNTEINEWVSKSQSEVKAVVDAGGTNSFMLDFDNATSLTTLGYDKSSKGNSWTCNNISLTAGVTYDHMLDVPGNSYATLNPIGSYAATCSNGNLKYTSAGNAELACSSVSFDIAAATKYCWEVRLSTVDIRARFGVIAEDANCIQAATYDNKQYYMVYPAASVFSKNTGTAYPPTDVAYSSNVPVVGNIIGVVAGSGQIEFFQNGASLGVMASSLTGRYKAVVSSPISPDSEFNFGQRPFAYSYGTAVALCQANLDSAETVTVSGTFTGNAAADGPFVWMNGVPKTLTINGNAVTFGTHADKTAGGFKVRTSSASYNTAGANTWTATIDSDLENCFKYRNAQGNP